MSSTSSPVSTALLLLPTSHEASDMIGLPQNLRYTEDITTGSGRRIKIICLRLDRPPRDIHKGFVFGSDPNECDIILPRNGISRVHFSIQFRPASGILVLLNKSSQGTVVCNDWLRSSGDNFVLRDDATIDTAYRLFQVRYPERGGYQRAYEQRQKQYVGALVSRSGGTAAITHATPVVPRRWIGDYIMLEQLGSGNFGTVHLLANERSGKVFAAKSFRPARGEERIVDQEIHLLRSLNHPNIVRYVDHIRSEGSIYIVMEHLPCGNLSQYYDLSTPTVVEVLRQIMTAVQYLHGKGITHRDLKPDNIVVECAEPMRIKVVDFGVARWGPIFHTMAGALQYMAPEIILETSYTPVVDIWAVGLIALSLLGSIPEREVNNFVQRRDEASFRRYDQALRVAYSTGRTQEVPLLWPAMLRRDPAQRSKPHRCLQLIEKTQDELAGIKPREH